MKKYKDHKIDELRDLCKEKGLDAIGKRDTLVSRLLTYDSEKSRTPDMFTKTDEIDPGVKPTETAKLVTSDNFYLQIKSSNLSNYFNFGYFYPLALEESEIYKNENRAKDILSTFEEYIIVGRTPFNQFENTDILIEFVLHGIKINQCEGSRLFYIAEPIPVSRVKTIYFKTVAAKSTFLSSIKTFPDSFIPNSICKIISIESEKSEMIDLEKIKLPRNENIAEWKDKLDLFDKTLGLLAFIKNAGVFYAERENKFENYSSGFFSTLNLINPIKQLASYKENAFLRPLFYYRNLEINSAQRAIFKSTIERVYSNKALDIKTAIEILETSIATDHSKNGEFADIKEQIDLFRQLDKLIISYKGILQKEVLRKNLPALALLFLSKFPNKSRQNTDKQAVRNSFIDGEFGLPLNIAEYILGFLGLYYGYKSLIKEDTNLKFTDKYFEQLANNSQSIKFKLDSYLDRFIIESAFQFAVKQTTLNDSYDFLNWNNESSNAKPIPITPSFQYDYVNNSFYIFGQQILNVQRRDKTEKVFEKISNKYPDRIDKTSYLATFLTKYLQLDKLHILDMLKKNKDRYPMEELEKVIEMDNQPRRNKNEPE